jgi:hypothetical protein
VILIGIILSLVLCGKGGKEGGREACNSVVSLLCYFHKNAEVCLKKIAVEFEK